MDHAITLILSTRFFLSILRSFLKAVAGLLDDAAEVSASARKLTSELKKWHSLS